MEFFRNRDIRQQCLLFAVVLLAATGAAFSVSRQAALPVFLTGAVFAAISLLFTWRRTRDVQRLTEELDSFLHMETKGSSSGSISGRGIWKCCGMRSRSCWSA